MYLPKQWGVDEVADEKRAAVTRRIGFCFPFSKIPVHDPDTELTELAAIVAGLVTVIVGIVAEPAMTQLRKRAETLADRLH